VRTNVVKLIILLYRLSLIRHFLLLLSIIFETTKDEIRIQKLHYTAQTRCGFHLTIKKTNY